MSHVSSTMASSPAGVWLGELAAAAQGGWQAVAASHGEQQQRRKLRAGPGEQKHKAPAPAGAAAPGGKRPRTGT
ncbi:uncharacterized protein C2845_PM05G02860 [Panicum miliaceum]|uniref:Uncharacterized protein n=1 Tax=Panicum miliaceum TaxID=4540 RepID=A0A3L6T3V6_PANMI|nr:uncharacterized protein C2845_PM05G02860 [Panicum miliaceum]